MSGRLRTSPDERRAHVSMSPHSGQWHWAYQLRHTGSEWVLDSQVTPRPDAPERQWVTVYPVVPNSPALPGWVQSVHASHQVILVGGVASCLRCSSIAARALGCATSMLKKPCRGFVADKGGNVRRLQLLGQGRLPHPLTEWPDELATPRDARPVYQLRHTGSEWVLDSQVTVVVTRFAAQATRFATWDPYSPPHVEG